MVTPVRNGYHCNWIGSGDAKSFFYPLRLFDSVANGGNNPNNQLLIKNFLETKPVDLSQDEANVRPVPVWWTVDLWGMELARPFLGVPVSSLGFGAAELLPFPENGLQRGMPMTHLQVRVEWMNNSSRTRFVDVDIGHGIRFSILSEFVMASVLIPRGGLEVVEGANPPVSLDAPILGAGDFVCDALVGGTISEGYAPVGQRIATYTQTIQVLATSTVQRVVIPPAAVQVQIFQGPVGTVTPMQFNLFELNATALLPPFVLGPTLGQIDFTAGQRRTAVIDVPQRAHAISIPTADPGNNRIFTFVWRLEL